MNNYELSRMIIDNVMKKVNSGGPVFYMEYVRSVETILNKYAAQQSAHLTVGAPCPECHDAVTKMFCETCGATFNAAQQSAQDGEGEEIDPVTQALRNLGDAIAPARR